jgi:hypothetical protein
VVSALVFAAADAGLLDGALPTVLLPLAVLLPGARRRSCSSPKRIRAASNGAWSTGRVESRRYAAAPSSPGDPAQGVAEQPVEGTDVGRLAVGDAGQFKGSSR